MSAPKDVPRPLVMAAVWLLLGGIIFGGWMVWEERQQRPSVQIITDQRGVTWSLPRARDGHYHMQAQVNGQPVDFLVDTGATRTTISREHAKRVGLSVVRTEKFSTAGGVVTGHVGRADLDLGHGVVFQGLMIAVLDDSDVRGLLGMDVLGQLDMSQQQGQLVLRAVPR